MAKSDILVRWKADTSNYDANIAKARRQLQGFATDNYTAGGAMKQLTSQALATAAKFASLGAAISGAMKVAKDAFMTSESNVDEWGRTMEGAKSIYQSFLQSLNNGDFSGFLSRIGEVISKAKDAYNALDELGTRLAIISPERAKLQARQTELRATIRRKGADSKEGKAAQNELKSLEPLLSKSYEVESELNRNAFIAEVDKKLAEAGLNLSKKDYDFLISTFSSDADFQHLRDRANGGTTGTKWETAGGWGSYKKDYDTRNLEQKLLDLFTDEWRQQYSPYLTASFNAQGAAASALLGNARYLRESGGGGGGKKGASTGAIQGPFANLSQLGGVDVSPFSAVTSEQTMKAMLGRLYIQKGQATSVSAYDNILKQINDIQTLLDAHPLAVELNISDAAAVHLQEEMAKLGKNIKPIDFGSGTNSVKTAKETATAWSSAAQAVSNVGSALQSIDDPSAKVAGIVAQAIANIALGFAQASASPATGAAGVFGWIAAATAGIATMVATITSIKNATAGSYAEGGIVPGSSFSGDNMYGRLNAGELILSRSQQSAIASQLSDRGGNSRQSQPYVSGEQIYLGLNNYLRRSNRGELMTSMG